jgi:hypothetical protein
VSQGRQSHREQAAQVTVEALRLAHRTGAERLAQLDHEAAVPGETQEAAVATVLAFAMHVPLEHHRLRVLAASLPAKAMVNLAPTRSGLDKVQTAAQTLRAPGVEVD